MIGFCKHSNESLESLEVRKLLTNCVSVDLSRQIQPCCLVSNWLISLCFCYGGFFPYNVLEYEISNPFIFMVK
jgi:hypothetical protein